MSARAVPGAVGSPQREGTAQRGETEQHGETAQREETPEREETPKRGGARDRTRAPVRVASRAVPSGSARESADEAAPPALAIRSLSLWYGPVQALHDVSVDVPLHRITAFIGPSGCGKSTLLRCCNRLNDLIDGVRVEGEIEVLGRSVYDPSVDVNVLRKRVGMVFQKSNPFPKSIYENVVYGSRIHGVRRKQALDDIAERSLRGAALWDEVKDRLDASALELSGGQQQRLCIARALAVEPEVILLDEPCSALDPIATAKIEELMVDLAKRYTLVIVTHNMQQASRVSDYTAFLYLGRLVEFDETERMFLNPKRRETEDYVTGRFG